MLFRHSLRALAFAVASAALTPSAVLACTCEGGSDVGQAGDAAEVVEGEVVDVGPSTSVGQPIQFRVEAKYKGHPAVTVGWELPVVFEHCNSSDVTVTGAAEIWFLSMREGAFYIHYCSLRLRADDVSRTRTERAVRAAALLGPPRAETAADPRTPAFAADALSIGWRLGILGRTRSTAAAGADAQYLLKATERTFGVRLFADPGAITVVDQAAISTVLDRVSVRTWGGRLLALGRKLAVRWGTETSGDPRRATVEAREREYLAREIVDLGGGDEPRARGVLDTFLARRPDAASVGPFVRAVCGEVLGKPGACESTYLDPLLLAPSGQ